MKTITIAGKLGRDAELKYVGTKGDAVASFSVAVDHREGREKSTIWFDCSMWGKRGEALAQHLTKGSAVAVSGDFGVRNYTAKDGTPKTAFSVRVNEITLLGGRPNGGGQRDAGGQQGGGDNWNEEDAPF